MDGVLRVVLGVACEAEVIGVCVGSGEELGIEDGGIPFLEGFTPPLCADEELGAVREVEIFEDEECRGVDVGDVGEVDFRSDEADGGFLGLTDRRVDVSAE